MSYTEQAYNKQSNTFILKQQPEVAVVNPHLTELARC